jgi:hypothetical protein
MGDQRVLERIDAWAAAGLIDQATALRLHAAETERETPAGQTEGGARLGLNIDVGAGEFFAYLGGAFLLAAYHWLTGQFGGGERVPAIGSAVVAIAFVIAATRLHGRPGATGRAAGALVLVAGLEAFAAGSLGLRSVDPVTQIGGLAGAATWLAVAVFGRLAAPGVLAQLGWIAAFSSLAWTSAERIGALIFGEPAFDPATGSFAAEPLRPLGLAAWMCAAAAVLVVAALREQDAGRVRGDQASSRRAAVTRFWAGSTAVLGTAAAVTMSSFDGSLAPIVGELMMAAVAAVFLLLAVRTSAMSYLYPAGLGFLVAFSHFNALYAADSIGVGGALLVEGVALLGVGFGIVLLRRRMGRPEVVPAVPPVDSATLPEPISH